MDPGAELTATVRNQELTSKHHIDDVVMYENNTND